MYERLSHYHMPHRTVMLVLILSGLFVTVACPASAADVVRAIEAGQNGSYQVRLSVSGDTVIGLTERLPSGASFISCSLPREQWNVSEGNLYLAVLGEPSITYAINVKESGELSGNWVDLSDGSTRNLPQALLGPDGRVEEASQATTIAAPSGTTASTTGGSPFQADTTSVFPTVSQPTRAGTGPGVLAASLVALVLAGTLIWRRSR
jgi:hypothetical protein